MKERGTAEKNRGSVALNVLIGAIVVAAVAMGGIAYGRKMQKSEDEKAFGIAPPTTIVGPAPTTLPGSPEAGVIPTTIAPVAPVAPVKPTPPAAFESGVVCDGPVPDVPDIYIDDSHALIKGTLSVIKGLSVSRGKPDLLDSFVAVNGEALARDLARLNGVNMLDPAHPFDPNNFPNPLITGKNPYYWPTLCHLPGNPHHDPAEIII